MGFGIPNLEQIIGKQWPAEAKSRPPTLRQYKRSVRVAAWQWAEVIRQQLRKQRCSDWYSIDPSGTFYRFLCFYKMDIHPLGTGFPPKDPVCDWGFAPGLWWYIEYNDWGKPTQERPSGTPSYSVYTAANHGGHQGCPRIWWGNRVDHRTDFNAALAENLFHRGGPCTNTGPYWQ